MPVQPKQPGMRRGSRLYVASNGAGQNSYSYTSLIGETAKNLSAIASLMDGYADRKSAGRVPGHP